MPFNKEKKTSKKQNTKQNKNNDGQIFINLELPMIINLELPVIREYNKKGFSSDDILNPKTKTTVALDQLNTANK